ncbi:Carbohydrate sulfotransferase 15 [Mactra antiquata]
MYFRPFMTIRKQRFNLIYGNQHISNLTFATLPPVLLSGEDFHASTSQKPPIINVHQSNIPDFITKIINSNQEDEHFCRTLTKTQIMHYKIQPEDILNREPIDFLSNFKNPCWLNPAVRGQESEILCLPYFYLVGAPKSGTTDLYRRTTLHPDIYKVIKEPHWFTRLRYTSRLKSLKDYHNQFLIHATRSIVSHSDVNGNHNIIFGDFSASNLWDNCNHNNVGKYKNSTESILTNADLIHSLNPNTRILVMLRNPVERLYSEYLFRNRYSVTPLDFHVEVLTNIQAIQECLGNFSTRHCIYKDIKINNVKARLQIGMYYIHLQEYFRVFPRNQTMVIKLEDYSLNLLTYMREVFSFLGLAPLNESLMLQIANPSKKANHRREQDSAVGDMLPKTRTILEEFYKPYNEQLVNLIGPSYDFNQPVEVNDQHK